MEIHSLHLSLTEDDLNGVINKELAKHQMVKNARLRVLPDGLKVNGVVRVLFDVAFESSWTLAVREGKLAVQLASLSALGLSANMLKSTLMRFVADAAKKTGGVHIHEETILVDIDQIVSRQGMNARVHLKAVSVAIGMLIIRAGSDTPSS